ncbi:group 10 secretory phospholipase A2 [Ctenodactylus gundi]
MQRAGQLLPAGCPPSRPARLGSPPGVQVIRTCHPRPPPTMLLLLLLLLAAGPGPFAASRKSHVHRRGIIELSGTVNCVGDKNSIIYMHYGCYCGFGGRGKPRDDVDWCCQRHDCCYNRAELAGCSPKLHRYNWECVDNQIQCGPAENECQELMCECDKEIAYCLAKAEYHIKYLFYPHMLCSEESPPCE